MIGTLRRASSHAAHVASGHTALARPQAADVRLATSQASGGSRTALVERVRTFVDRTLDAARGRFDF